MSDHIVDLIRERTDEQDINKILKSTMGGYTKKSVLDYLAQLKRQQQTIVATFNQDMQSMLEEKEHLQAEKDGLQAKLTKVEADYHDLYQTLVTYQSEDSEYSLEDVLKLKGTIAAQEKDIDEAVARISQDEQTMEQQKILLEDKDTQVQKAMQEARAAQEQFLAERNESASLRKRISGLSQTITELQNEVLFLKQITSDGVVGDLKARISELLSTVDQQQALVQSRDEDLSAKSQIIDSYVSQSTTDRASIENLTHTMDAMNLQIEKLEAANQVLLSRLQAVLADSVRLSCEKSDLTVEKAVLSRKLEIVNLQDSLQQIAPSAAVETPADPEQDLPDVK